MMGSVYVNGQSNVKMKHVSKYCTQEDALFGSLTVRETLGYAADFNLAQNTLKKDKNRIVDELIVEFGLKDVENTIIGTPLSKGCSGGQVRRVSVASQLIGMDGGILFLDEPTSGLDSVAAFQWLNRSRDLQIIRIAQSWLRFINQAQKLLKCFLMY